MKKIRNKPFHNNKIIGMEEKKLIDQVLNDKEFSGFIGSKNGNMSKVLKLSSHDAFYKGKEFVNINYLGGKMNRKFESDLSQKFNIKYVINVNSATSALCMSIAAINPNPGDEVICTCLSFTATATSIVASNCVPVFTDINSKNFCMEISEIEKKITKRTKAIMVVHLWGFTVNMLEIMKIAKKYSLFVIEDASQAIGCKSNDKFVGTIGDIGVFSYNEPKNIQTGEGGSAITNNSLLASRMRMIRNHGENLSSNKWDKYMLSNIVGMNYRMTSLTAAIGIAQLKKLDFINSKRKENSEYLFNNLKKFYGVLDVPDFSKDEIPHVFPMVLNLKVISSIYFLDASLKDGIPLSIGYSRLMYQNHLFLKKIAFGINGFPWERSAIDYNVLKCGVAESLQKMFVCFAPIFPPNNIRDMDDVIKVFLKILDQKK